MTPRSGVRVPSEHGVRTVMANAGSLLLAYVLPRAFTFGAIIAAARVLGASEFGAYGTAAAYAVILSVVATLGMTPLLIREIAQAPARAPQLIRAAHLAKTGSNLVMLGTLFLLARYVLDYPEPVVTAALLLGLAYAIAAYVENLSAYFQAVERMHVWLQASALYGLVTGALGVILVAVSRDLVVFCLAPVAGHAAALVWLLWRLPADVRKGAATRPGDVRNLLAALAPFAASFVILTIYYKADVLLLAQWRPASDVGLYTAGYKFADITVALAGVAAGAVFPRLSRAALRGGHDASWAAGRLSELALLATVPLAAGLWLLRAPVVAGLFGADYRGAVPVVAFLAAALPALTVNVLSGYVLGAARRMTQVAVLYALGTVLKLGLNAWLIPRYGATGAAAAMLSAEAALMAGMLVTVRRLVGASVAPRPALAALATVVLCVTLAALRVPLGLAIGVLFAAVTAAIYWSAGVVRPEEWLVFRQVLQGWWGRVA